MRASVEAWFATFESSIQQEVGHNYLETNQTDWKQLTDFHLDLLQQVTKLHIAEERTETQEAVERAIKAESVIAASPEGSRGHRIYVMNHQEDMICDCIGDIHSDSESLMNLLKLTGFIESCLSGRAHRLVFMGDYVDRGKSHLALLGRLLCLKIAFPDRVFLLRGNHDGGVLEGPEQVKLPYRKPEDEPDEDYFPTYLIQLKKHHPEAEPLLKAYLDFFNTLGQLAVIKTNGKITLAVHGGVPRPVFNEGHYYTYLKRLSDLSDANHLDAHGRTMVQNIMWSDPYRGRGDLREGLGRFFFTEAQFDDFADRIGIDQMIRGHESVKNGYKAHFGGKVYTIFSSGQWLKQPKNPLTAYPEVSAKWARVTSNGKIEIHPKKSDICY